MKISPASELAKGNFIVIYDGVGREGEADLVIGAQFAAPDAVAAMRTHAGGLLCLATSEDAAGKIGLPFMSDLLLNDERLADMIYSRTSYGDKPAFSISINHADAKTGISDEDRSRTIISFGGIIAGKPSAWREKFISTFRTPGHVHLLIGRGIANRRGHTELSLELIRQAGLPPAVALCEIAGSRKAMTLDAAKAIAKKNGWVFVEGKDI